MAGTRLGAFELLRPVGRGGMGEVFGGRHVATGTPVAVKLLHAEQARRPVERARFLSEVRAVGSLDHPDVIRVFDYGQIQPDEEEATDGRLIAGSPWLAMELASGGSLADLLGDGGAVIPWKAQRALLLRILDGLAHAHAHGLVHLDLKPANVVVCGPSDPRPGLKLSDFGLASLVGRAAPADDGEVLGTPLYMAPEQLDARSQDFGPWTDLYALGCLSFVLATGVAPFQGPGFMAIAFSHLQGRRAPFEPRTPVPAEYLDWLDRLLRVRPGERFQRAADAAWALRGLPDTDGPALVATLRAVVPVDQRLPAGRPADTGAATQRGARPGPAPGLEDILAGAPSTRLLAAWETPTVDLSEPTTERRRAGVTTGSTQSVDASPVEVPPMPRQWRGRTELSDPLLAGAGLGLVGLRSPRMVGREAERDELWQALGQVRASQQPRAVLLRGVSGTGKSRLARWLCERAHELGAATPFVARHAPSPGPGHGLAAIVERRCGLLGLEGEARTRQLHAHLQDWPVDLGASAVAALADDEAFAHPRDRYAAFAGWMLAAAGGRPAILWLDDLQWGPDAVRQATWLLRAGEVVGPILVVATVQEEALSERPAAARRLADLAGHPACSRLTVGPLPPSERPTLLRNLLGLTQEAAATAQRVTGGNPLFAVQLVEDWARRGVIRATERGFELAPDSVPRLPANLSEVWTSRVDRFLTGRPDADRQAVYLAACLGETVAMTEWQAVADELGLGSARPALAEELVAERLARPAEAGLAQGFVFIHGMLALALREAAERDGASQALHAACARVIARSPRLDLARLGAHLLDAGQPVPAATALLDAAERGLGSGHLSEAADLLARRASALAAVDSPLDPHEAVRSDILWAGIERASGRYPSALARAEAAVQASRSLGDDRLLSGAVLEHGRVLLAGGQTTESRPVLAEAWQLARRCGHRFIEAMALRQLGVAELSLGRADEAEDALEQALEHFRELGLPGRIGFCAIFLSQVAKSRGDFAATDAWLVRARAAFAAVGHRSGLGEVANGRGDLARLRGDLDAAEDLYARALRIYRDLGSGDVPIVEANLGMTQAARQDWWAARRSLEASSRALRIQGNPDIAGAVEIALLPVLAALSDWAGWDRALQEGRALLQDHPWVHVDIASAAQHGAQRAQDAGELDRAAAAWTLARQQWAALGRTAEAHHAQARIAAARRAGRSRP